MALTLTQFLPPTRSGRTFFLASSLLGLCAFLQLSLLGWYFVHRGARVSPQAAGAPGIRFAETTQPGVPAVDAPAQSSDPSMPTPAPALAQAGTVPTDGAPAYSALPQPTPVQGPRLPTGSGDMLEQARALRQRGDMRAALGRLREALVAEPDNPQAIAEEALTYEAMQLPDKAFEQWQRIFSMGESIGALYYLADSRLHNAPAGATGAAPVPAGVAPAAGGAPQDNAVLKITDVHTEDIPDPSVERKLALKIVVKGRPGVVIDPDKVKIEAYFYDLVEGKDIVQTDAQTDYAWLTPPPINWANDKSEVLEAMYVRTKGVALMPSPPAMATPSRNSRRGTHNRTKVSPDGAEATAAQATPPPAAGPAPVRAYLGYTVRLYYDRQLQDVQADPVRLLQQFQPPLTLPAD